MDTRKLISSSIRLLCMSLLCVMFSSCEAFLMGMAGGMSSGLGTGMYGNYYGGFIPSAFPTYNSTWTATDLTPYTTPAVETSTSATTSTTTSTSSSGSSTQCLMCHGTGRMEYNSNPSSYGVNNDYKITCPECGKQVLKSSGHTHITCKSCHGKGYY